MNQNRVISTAVLFLLLGITALAFAQKAQEEKGGGTGKAQQAQHPQRPQHTQQAQHQQQPQHANRRNTSRSHNAHNRCNTSSNHSARGRRSAHSRLSGAEGSRDNALLTTVATTATIMAAFLTTVTVPILVVTTGSAWAVPGFNGYNRFQYGGYWFGFNEPWPSGWYYTDDVYVEYVGGAITCTTRGIPAFTLRSTCSNDLSSTPSGEDSLGTGRVAPRVE